MPLDMPQQNVTIVSHRSITRATVGATYGIFGNENDDTPPHLKSVLPYLENSCSAFLGQDNGMTIVFDRFRVAEGDYEIKCTYGKTSPQFVINRIESVDS
jgi:hypothetical protein